MIALKVKLNGRKITTAGTEDLSVLNASATLRGKLGSKTLWTEDDPPECNRLRVGGLTSRGEGKDDEHIDWAKKSLKVGDSIEVTILETKKANKPISFSPAKKTSEKEDDERREREWYEYAKSHYFRLKDKYEGTGNAE
ncbi:MAG: hypothetical protein HZA22_00940 [Nitrospirae bacterium]|nr:hypothetical protein [Nitrospirota bacterium]